MKIINKYFPFLTKDQIKKFSNLKNQYIYWNSKINLISKNTIDEFYINHVLHSLAISKVIQFSKSNTIIDVGTGGGFPGIPLAILYPNSKFFLVDSIGKKINVVNNIVKNLNIKNIQTINERVENLDLAFDFIVSRGVTKMSKFLKLVDGKVIKKKSNGILYLKGGDLENEMKNIDHLSFNISDFFSEKYFLSKKIIFVKNSYFFSHK